MTIEKLKQRLETEFANLSLSPSLATVLEPGFADKRLYAIYLIETYHYTRHNSRNQAVVATRPEEIDIRYMKFCLRHAEEEYGHEKMALHDLKNLGVVIAEAEMPEPLSSTQTLIAYLYHIAKSGNPYARMGYSFWAEQSYQYITPLLNMLTQGVGVSKQSMTFFNEHSSIDEEHARVVTESIRQFAKTEADWSAIEECMVNSLKLTAAMMEEVFTQFCKVKRGEPNRYERLFTKLGR